MKNRVTTSLKRYIFFMSRNLRGVESDYTS